MRTVAIVAATLAMLATPGAAEALQTDKDVQGITRVDERLALARREARWDRWVEEVPGPTPGAVGGEVRRDVGDAGDLVPVGLERRRALGGAGRGLRARRGVPRVGRPDDGLDRVARVELLPDRRQRVRLRGHRQRLRRRTGLRALADVPVPRATRARPGDERCDGVPEVPGGRRALAMGVLTAVPRARARASIRVLVTISETEARTIAGVVAEADGACLLCVADLACRLDKAIPWVDWRRLIVEEANLWSVEALEARGSLQVPGS